VKAIGDYLIVIMRGQGYCMSAGTNANDIRFNSTGHSDAFRNGVVDGVTFHAGNINGECPVHLHDE
jgi:hypothetical protein